MMSPCGFSHKMILAGLILALHLRRKMNVYLIYFIIFGFGILVGKANRDGEFVRRNTIENENCLHIYGTKRNETKCSNHHCCCVAAPSRPYGRNGKRYLTWVRVMLGDQGTGVG